VYYLAVVNFIFHVEWPLGCSALPMLLSDDALDLGEAIRCSRMRSEISFETLDGKFRELLFGVLRVNYIFRVELIEALEQRHGAIGRIPAQYRQMQSFPIGLQFFVFAVSDLPRLQRYLNQFADDPWATNTPNPWRVGASL
jgi:hypothetical protein